MSASIDRGSSEYMRWAKTASHAPFNLATSGLSNVPAADLEVSIGDIEITGVAGYGYPPLLERIAAHVRVPTECVVAAAGTSMANHFAMAALLQPGDEVLIEHPAYALLLDLAKYLGLKVRRFHRRFDNGFAIEPDEIAAMISPRTRLIVVTNLHNPSGALLSDETLRSLGQIAERAGVCLLVDEVYLEMLFGDARSAFHLADIEDNPFLITSSLTKAYGLSGLRCGWIIAEPGLAARIWALNDLFGVNAAHPAERLSVVAFDRMTQLRAAAKQRLEINRAILDEFLDRQTALDCYRPAAGTVVFPRLRSGNVEAFVEKLRSEYQTSVVPGRFFEMPEHFRIGIGGDSDELREGLSRLDRALREQVG